MLNPSATWLLDCPDLSQIYLEAIKATLCTTRVTSKQLYLDLSKPRLTCLYANTQQEFTIYLVSYRSRFIICNQLFSHLDLY